MRKDPLHAVMHNQMEVMKSSAKTDALIPELEELK